MAPKNTTLEQFYSYTCSHGEHGLCTNYPEKSTYGYDSRVTGCECPCHFTITTRKPETRKEVLTELSYAMWHNQARVDTKEFARLIKKFLSTVQPTVYDDEVDALIPVFKETVNKDYWSRSEFYEALDAVKVIEQPKLI